MENIKDYYRLLEVNAEIEKQTSHWENLILTETSESDHSMKSYAKARAIRKALLDHRYNEFPIGALSALIELVDSRISYVEYVVDRDHEHLIRFTLGNLKSTSSNPCVQHLISSVNASIQEDLLFVDSDEMFHLNDYLQFSYSYRQRICEVDEEHGIAAAVVYYLWASFGLSVSDLLSITDLEVSCNVEYFS